MREPLLEPQKSEGLARRGATATSPQMEKAETSTGGERVELRRGGDGVRRGLRGGEGVKGASAGAARGASGGARRRVSGRLKVFDRADEGGGGVKASVERKGLGGGGVGCDGAGAVGWCDPQLLHNASRPPEVALCGIGPQPACNHNVSRPTGAELCGEEPQPACDSAHATVAGLGAVGPQPAVLAGSSLVTGCMQGKRVLHSPTQLRPETVASRSCDPVSEPVAAAATAFRAVAVGAQEQASTWGDDVWVLACESWGCRLLRYAR